MGEELGRLNYGDGGSVIFRFDNPTPLFPLSNSAVIAHNQRRSISQIIPSKKV